MASPRPASPGRRPGGARPDGGQRTARAAARRTAARGPGGGAVPPARSQGLTRRALVLALVLVGLVLSAAVPVRELLAQRAEIDRVEAAQDAQRERIAALETRRARFEDPEHVARLARERLHYVMPGETAYVVLRPEPTEQEKAEQEARRVAEQAWYSQLWGSVRAADAER